MFTKYLLPASARIALILALMAGLFSITPVRADSLIRYVKWNASGANDGSSWTDAYTDLQSALTAASSGDEIWVATGTYKPTTGTDRTISFVLKDGVAIYGGFTGTETSRTQRLLFYTHYTILSGDIGVVDNDADNSYHVVVGSNTTSSTILDGFTITQGNADGLGENANGGGVYLYVGSPSFAHLTLRVNSAQMLGGGMYAGEDFFDPTPSNPTLDQVTFDGNTAMEGGGLLNEKNSDVALTNVIFRNNVALRAAGGMENRSNATLTDVVFEDNDGGTPGPGGLFNLAGNASLTNVTFRGNSSSLYGGGMANASGNQSLTNVTFSGNSAAYGGGIYNTSAHPTLTNVTLGDNSATAAGGGIYSEANTTIVIRNTILWGNTAHDGAQIYNDGSVSVVSDSVVQGGFTGGVNIVTTDPFLGPLGNHSGFAETIPLQAGSSAIDTGNDTSCPSTDERGMPRPQGGHCDIGAFEYRHVIQHVKWDATGANNGTSWANAFTNLQSALSASLYGDEVWIAAGTYYPTNGTDRTISFALQNGMAMYGGFSGIETLRAQRDFELNTTVLSGDIGVANDNSDNSYHVVIGIDTDNSAALDGFTVTAGNANGELSESDGGGIYSRNSDSTIANMTFIHNSAQYGGGAWINQSSSTLTNVTFTENSATLDGGGMAAGRSNLILTDLVFIHNSARYGGGANISQGSSTLKNVDFTKNSATLDGGGMYNSQSNAIVTDVTFDANSASSGGGMSNSQGWGGQYPVLTNVSFVNNIASSAGGGMANSQSNPSLTHVTFTNNTASSDGGGMANTSSSPNLSDVTFMNNIAHSHGGGMHNTTVADPNLTNVTFVGNSAASGGGMSDWSSDPALANVTFKDNSATSFGGGIYNNSISRPTLTNVTISDNSATIGGGVYNTLLSTLTIQNTILWGNSASTGAQIYNDFPSNSTSTVGDSVVQGGYSGGTHIITANPLLGTFGNYGGFTETLPLQAGSSAIDTGNDTNCPASDQRGVTRPQGSHCDIGAYEHAGFFPPSPTPSLTNTPASTPTGTTTFIPFTPSPTPTPTLTASASPTRTPTRTATATGTATLGYTPTSTSSPSATPTRTATAPGTGTETPISNCNAVSHGPLTINGTMSLGLTNQTGLPLVIKEIFVAWNAASGHASSGDQTLILQQASINGVSFWNGNNAGPNIMFVSSNLYLPPGNSTLQFTFHQSYDRPDNRDEISIYLGTNGCQSHPIRVFYEPVTPTPTPSPMSPPPPDADTTGVFRPSNGLLYLKSKNDTGFADAALNYGLPGDYPVVGDWDGNGTTTIGIYRKGYFYLKNSNTLGFAEIVFPFGKTGDQPIAGDWNEDGVDTVGIFRPSTGQFLLRNSNTEGSPEMSFYLGNVGDVGIAGDWDGDGKDTTGVFRPSNGVIFLKNKNEDGFADIALNYGLPGDKPVTGDWDNDGVDTIGVYRSGQFMLRNSNTIGFAEIIFGLGNPGDMPIAGNWDGLP